MIVIHHHLMEFTLIMMILNIRTDHGMRGIPL